MAAGWSNWAGDQHCTPVAIERPATLGELQEVVRRAAECGHRVRGVGSGHSFTDVALTDGVLVQLDLLSRILDVDRQRHTVKVEAGIVLGQLNRQLDALDLALENLGDIDRQTIAGSISTGTHGTGIGLPSVSAQVEAVDMVTADGELRTVSEGDELEAARVGLGVLGLIYAVTLRTVPAFTIDRTDMPRPLEQVLSTLDELTTTNDHFEFYVFPHTRTALCRESRRTDEPPRPRHRALVYAREVMVENWVGAAFARTGRAFPKLTPQLAKLASKGTGRATKVDRSHRVFASERRIKFTEMEYAVPREVAAEVVPRVLEVAARPEHAVAFPIEVRFVSGDTPLLSTSHGRDTAYIAVHQDTKLDWETYFRAVEQVMNGYDGRPHWGKRHFQTAETLSALYPRWDDFTSARTRFDPDRRFANAYTDRVLGA